jgi:hypothetical protein
VRLSLSSDPYLVKITFELRGRFVMRAAEATVHIAGRGKDRLDPADSVRPGLAFSRKVTCTQNTRC